MSSDATPIPEEEEEEQAEPVLPQQSRPHHVGLCGKSECIRTRALLRAAKGAVVYRPIEQVRVRALSWLWLISLVIALGWSVACVQKENVVLGILNFVGAFLPLWRQLYVETPLHWMLVAWGIMVATFYLL